MSLLFLNELIFNDENDKKSDDEKNSGSKMD